MRRSQRRAAVSCATTKRASGWEARYAAMASTARAEADSMARCTAAGSSWQFIALITAGYVAGIAAKFVSGSVNWVLAVYLLNIACIGVKWFV